ncbi:MAG: hypothetical protein KAJ56_05010 [Candidatus Aenigmarchaeota archaeon]|nr:hypothetical protein [Candidatus Aenigmarchaeota archaeon]
MMIRVTYYMIKARKGSMDLELIIKICLGLLAFTILIIAASYAMRKLGVYGGDFVPTMIKNVFSG